MQIILDAYKNSGILHHAYFIEGEKDIILPELLSFIEKKVKVPIKACADFYHQEYESFGIDDSRELRRLSSRKAIVGNKKIFVLTFNTITHEAQNALLKLFEEPTPNTHFFIVTLNADKILSTLKSRMFVVHRNYVAEKKNKLSENFFNLSPKERLDFIKDMVENKDKNKAMELLNGLEASIYKKSQKKGLDSENIKILKEIGIVRNYMGDRSPSIKMLLEHIALILPTSSKQ